MLNTFFPLSRGQATVRGLIALIVGVVFVVWPGISVGTAVVLFAIYCVMDAGVQIGNLFAGGASAGTRVLRLLLGLLDIVAAAVAVIYPGPTAGVLVIVIGFWAIFGGVAEIWSGFALSSGWLGVSGLLSVIAGVLLVAWPDIGAVSLAIVVGAYLAAYGIVLLAGAITAPKGSDVSRPAPI